MKPDRFELPECRNEALLLATNAIEAGTGDVRDEALQWLDCALSDALVDLGRYKAALEEIAYRKTTRGRQPSARVIARQAIEKEQLTCPTCGEPLREMHRGLPYCPPCEFQAGQNMSDDEEVQDA